MKRGTYRYKHRVPTGQYPYWKIETYSVRCEIVEERETQYVIKLLGFHAKGYPLGHVMRVMRKKVKLDEQLDTSLLREPPRLPYKDD